MKHLGDITRINGAGIEPVDVVTGGSPCQDLSVAGKRAGLDGEHSGLFMEQLRIIREMRENERKYGREPRPRYMVWENVVGAFSSNKREDFRVVLEETARVTEPDAIVPRPPKNKWTNAGAILGDGWSIAWRVCDAQFWGVPQRRRRIALVADFGGLSATEILFERESVQGDSFEGGTERKATSRNTTSSSEETGESINQAPTAFAFLGGQGSKAGNIGFQEECSPTLSSSDGGNTRSPCILDMTHACDVIRECGETVPTLQGRMGTGGNQVPLVFDELGDQFGSYIYVRRLTPMECERLQDFPDEWTRIGEWIDENGKRHKEADSQRYKAIGNSIALPNWRWIMNRIADQYDRSATLGSLFDGIGGFPLVWEERNGKGSAKWASEIEPFPIAVTKRRFGED